MDDTAITTSVGLTVAQWSGAITGFIGSWCVGSLQPKTRMLGFISFTISNILLIGCFLVTYTWPLMIMQTLFCYTSIRGIMNNRASMTSPAAPKCTTDTTHV